MGRPLKSVFKKEHRDDIANRSANPVFSEVAEVFLSRRRFLQMGAVAADQMGMLATLQNCLYMRDTLTRLGVAVTVMSAVDVLRFAEPYNAARGVQLLSEGKPAAGIECEIEYINTDVNVQTNSFGKGTKGTVPDSAWVVVTDSNGMFTFGIPKPGVWGFACLGSGPAKKFQDKELSQDAVLWINATQMK